MVGVSMTGEWVYLFALVILLATPARRWKERWILVGFGLGWVASLAVGSVEFISEERYFMMRFVSVLVWVGIAVVVVRRSRRVMHLV